MGSNAGKDVEIRISIPIPGSQDYKAGGGSGPWGTPCSREEAAARIASLRKVLGALDGLLEAAQAALRAGHLCDGADRLDWLQRWYAELQAELRCLEQEKAD